MDVALMFSIVGLIIAVAAVIVVSYKGYSPIICFPLAALFICLTSGLNLTEGVLTTYAGSFAKTMGTNTFNYLCACLFSKVLIESKAAYSIADWMSGLVNPKFAPTIIMLMAGLLTMGGMGVGVYMIVFPIAMALCYKASYSKDIIMGAVLSGCWTWALAIPFSASNQNNICVINLETSTYAGLIPGLVGCLTVLIGSALYLQWQAETWKKKGRVFNEINELPEDNEEKRKSYPPVWRAWIPIIFTVVIYNALQIPLAVALTAGSLIGSLLEFKVHSFKEWFETWQAGMIDGVMPVINVATKAGLGGVVAVTPCYLALVDNIATINVHPYILAFMSTSFMAAVVGGSTASLNITLPQERPIFDSFIAQNANVSMGNLHRLSMMGAVTFDSLPHSGSVLAVATMFKTTHRKSYWPVFWTTVILPTIGGLIALLLSFIF